jgi:hypothetical protein
MALAFFLILLTAPAQFGSDAPEIVESVALEHPQLAWKFLQRNDRPLFAALGVSQTYGSGRWRGRNRQHPGVYPPGLAAAGAPADAD